MNHADRITRLSRWLQQNGGYLQETIEIVYHESEGYHLKASQAIDPIGYLVHIPRTLTLSISTLSLAKSNWPTDFLTHYLAQPYVVTRFLLMDEFLYHDTSWWYPYISLLPQPLEDVNSPPFNTPLWFSEEDTRWLEGTGLRMAAREMSQLWQAEYTEGIKFLESLPNYNKYTWMLYKWAATVLSSRCFPSDKYADEHGPLRPECEEKAGVASQTSLETNRYPVLVPVLDLANHNPEVRMQCQISEDGYTLRLNEDVPKGKQVYISYGSKSNEELLMGYGFVIPENSADFLGLSFPILDTARKWCAQRVIIEGKNLPLCVNHFQLGLEHCIQSEFTLASDVFRLRAGTEPPVSLFDAIRLNIANERELKELYCSEGQSSKRSSVQALAQLFFALLRRNELLSASPSLSEAGTSTINQLIARRYAFGQAKILKFHLHKLLEDLKEIRLSPFAFSLEKLLRKTSQCLEHGMRELCRAVCGTRNHVTLKAQGLEDSIMIIFICLLWVLSPNEEEVSGTNDTTKELRVPEIRQKWYSFTRSAYCPPPNSTGKCAGINCFCSSKCSHPWSISESVSGFSREHAAEVLTAHAIVHRAFSLDLIDPIFDVSSRWTKDFLQWAYGIWVAEAVVLPFLPHESKHYTLNTHGLEDIETERVLYFGF